MLTQAKLIEKVAATDETLTKKQVKLFFDNFAEIAYKEAKNGVAIPGIGKLVLVKRKARVGRNPKTGESIKIPAKTAVKVRVSKTAKEAILGVKAAPKKGEAPKKAGRPKKE